MDSTLKNLLTKASLYGLLAKRYECVDPQKQMYFYQKHFLYAMKVEQRYMMVEGSNPGSDNTMITQYPMH